MAVLPIIEYPDPRLRLRAAHVTAFDADLERLIADLLETLRTTGGIALSAPQIGDRRRVAVVALTDGAPSVYVNPEILTRSAPGFVQESCLSVPGIVASVWRATQVKLRACDPAGVTFERSLAGMDAVSLQHEIDHLEGKLFIDRLWLGRRLLVMARLDARARRAGAEGAGLTGAA